jgi:hypothetical protein
MANTPNVPKSNKISKTFVAAVIGWGLIAITAFAGAGFYFGYQYREGQVKHDAQIIKAATATPAPAPAAEVPKSGSSEIWVGQPAGSQDHA